MTPAGLPAGTIRVSTLVANSVDWPTRSCSVASFIVEVLAVARTSAVLPSARAETRSWEPWKSKVTERSGCCAVKSSASSSKASCREAAAKTVSSPDSEVAEAWSSAVAEAWEEVAPDPHPASAAAARVRADKVVTTVRRELRMAFLSGMRRIARNGPPGSRPGPAPPGRRHGPAWLAGTMAPPPV